MGINRFYKSEPVQFQLPEIPLQPLMMALESKQKRFDTGYELSAQLRNQYLDALPQDRAIADEWSKGINQNIDQLVNQYDGDYSRLNKDLRVLQNKVQQDLAPGGIGNAILSNKKAYTSALDTERKRLAKGEITQDQLGSWMNYTLSNYTGVGEKDPISGNYNTLTPEDVAKYISSYDVAQPIAEDLPSIINADEVVGLSSDNKWIVKRGEKIEEVSPDRIQQAVAGSLMSNPEYLNYLQQIYKFKGQQLTPDNLALEIGSVADNLAQVYSRRNFTGTRDMKANPYMRDLTNLQNTLSLMAPAPVQTKPGLTQNTEYSKAKITQPYGSADVSTVRPEGAESAPFLPGTGIRPTPGFRVGTPVTNFNDYTTKVGKNVPDKLKGAFEKLSSEIGSSPGTDYERAQRLQERWNNYVDQISTFTPTDIQVDPGYLQGVKQLWEQGLGFSAGTQWYELSAEGTTDPVKTKTLKGMRENADKFLPVGITAMGDRVGFQVVGPDNKTYVVSGVNDKLVSQLSSVQKLYSPLIGNEDSASVEMTYPITDQAGNVVQQIPVTVKSRLNTDLNNPGLELQYYTKDENGKEVLINKTTGQAAKDEVSSILEARAGEFFRDQFIGSPYLRSREGQKMLFDRINLSQSENNE